MRHKFIINRIYILTRAGFKMRRGKSLYQVAFGGRPLRARIVVYNVYQVLVVQSVLTIQPCHLVANNHFTCSCRHMVLISCITKYCFGNYVLQIYNQILSSNTRFNLTLYLEYRLNLPSRIIARPTPCLLTSYVFNVSTKYYIIL